MSLVWERCSIKSSSKDRLVSQDSAQFVKSFLYSASTKSFARSHWICPNADFCSFASVKISDVPMRHTRFFTKVLWLSPWESSSRPSTARRSLSLRSKNKRRKEFAIKTRSLRSNSALLHRSNAMWSVWQSTWRNGMKKRSSCFSRWSILATSLSRSRRNDHRSTRKQHAYTKNTKKLQRFLNQVDFF